MSLGLIGLKLGMTRIFTDDGTSVPVTVLGMASNRVAQVKTPEIDGYAAIQVAFGSRRRTRVTKSMAGHFAKAGIESAQVLREFRLPTIEISGFQAGQELTVEVFVPGQRVDVTGISKGKGFSGVIKRHHFSSNRASHGNSVSHNKPGSIGQAQDPGRVFPGKRMAGHLGAVRTTTLGLEVVRVDKERGLLLVKGAVPGSRGNTVLVRPAVRENA